MANNFFASACEPYQFGPYDDESAFLTLCFLDLLMIALTVLLLATFGVMRFLQIRRRLYERRSYTVPHILNIVCSVISVFMPLANLIFSIVSYSKNPNAFPLPWMKYFVIAGLVLTWFWASVLMEMEYTHGMKHGWVVITFWVISALLNGFRVQAYANEEQWENGTLYFVIVELVASVVLSLNTVLYNKLPPFPQGYEPADGYNSDFSLEELSGDEKKEKDGLLQGNDSSYGIIQRAQDDSVRLAEDKAGFISRYSYYWITPLLEKGYRQQLKLDDMPDLCQEDYADKQLREFDDKWARESENPEPSLTMTLIRLYGTEFFIAGLFKIGNDIGIFAGPVFLQQIVRFISDSKDAPFYIGLLLSMGMFLGKVMELICVNIYFQHVFRINMKIKSALTQIIFTKSLRLDSDRGGFSLGEVVTLQGIDTKKIGENITYLHNVWSAPVQILVSIGLLWQVLGWASLGGLIVLFLSLPLNLYVGKIQTTLQSQIMTIRSKRAKQTNEVMQGIRVVKFFAWEQSFLNLIEETREEELKILKSAAYLRALSTFLWSFIPILVSITSFALLMARGKQLTAEIAFTALSLFNVMRFPLLVMPMVITSVVNAKVSIERIQKFLLGKELDRFAVLQDDFMEQRVLVSNGTFSWNTGDEKKEALSNINFSAAEGELIAVVGEVGSGKSSLVSAILGDMPKISGVVKTRGTLAYVPQQAFLQNGTVKENILFGLAYDDQKYRSVVKACELIPDFEMLPAGERTEIGEKGINLSGGQKQRISLARAVYSNADIFVMDDPLSALDQHVGKSIFDNCICTILKGKTIILVTHQLQHLNKCDKILVFKEGKISEVGTYDHLMQTKGEFSKLIAKHTTKSLKTATKKQEEETVNKEGTKTASDSGKIIDKETGQKGGVSNAVYLAYISKLGGPFIFGLILMFSFLQNGGDIGTNYWLTYWAEQNLTAANVTANTTVTEVLNEILYAAPTSVWFYFGIYAAIGCSIAVFSVASSFTLALASLNSSRSIHTEMITHTLQSPMSFFDTTPVGRVLNRLNSDIASVDETLPQTMGMALRVILGVLSILAVIGSVTPIFLVILIPLSYLYRFTQKYYLNSSREIQRIESMSKSPIYSLFGECLNGASTIRAFRRVDELNSRNTKLVQQNSEAYNAWYTCNRWLSLRLEFVGSVVVFGACFFSVLNRGELQAAQAGLAITYSLQLTGFLNWMVRMTTEVENAFVSVERCIEYTTLPSEAPRICDHRPASNWPNKGQIQFKNFSLRYREGLPLILEGVNIEIFPNEKIGVVGRTGAGKSSLMLALFRVVEPDTGTIVIDGEDICKIGLDDLRSKISIIPQDPTLFTGTVRSNLDPFGQYSDQRLWEALHACSLKAQVEGMEKGLDSEIKEGGGNLSVGSRQLVCLGRAILKRSKILVMDEATASVDYETDSLIQATIRKEFKDCTVLTIAHRIKTILDNDRVLVLEKGKIIEFDSPNNLIQRRDSVFYSLASSS